MTITTDTVTQTKFTCDACSGTHIETTLNGDPLSGGPAGLPKGWIAVADIVLSTDVNVRYLLFTRAANSLTYSGFGDAALFCSLDCFLNAFQEEFEAVRQKHLAGTT